VEKGTSKIGDIPRLHPFAFGISSKLALDAHCIAKHTSSCFFDPNGQTRTGFRLVVLRMEPGRTLKVTPAENKPFINPLNPGPANLKSEGKNMSNKWWNHIQFTVKHDLQTIGLC